MSERHDPTPLFAPSAEQLDDWRIELTKDMAEVKTMLKTLVGNGQPGKIAIMETRIGSLETAKNRLAGGRCHLGGGGLYDARGLYPEQPLMARTRKYALG